MANPVLHDKTPQEIHSLLEEGKAVLVDVREPGEYEADRIPGALLFPLSEFDPKYLPNDPNRPVILHCGTGKRSGMAAHRMFQAGAAECQHMAGGIQAWKRAGLPTITFDPSTGKWRQVVS